MATSSPGEVKANNIYDAVVDKDLHEGEELSNFLSTGVHGSFFEAILARCTVFVTILVGLLGGGNLS